MSAIKFKIDPLPDYFDSTVGDDVDVRVAGDYSRPDPSVGYLGDFEVTRVWIPSDPLGTDIQSLLSATQFERLESEGWQIVSKVEAEKKWRSR